MGAAGRLGLTGRAQPIFIKQLKCYPTVWKRCLRLLMEVRSRIMLKLPHQRMEFPHFFKFFFLKSSDASPLPVCNAKKEEELLNT
jgi:hypothetical protein